MDVLESFTACHTAPPVHTLAYSLLQYLAFHHGLGYNAL